MGEQEVETIRKAYEDFNSGNVEGVIGILDENVQWTEPGGGKSPSGTFTGPQSVAEEVFAAIPQNFDEFSASPENFDDQGDRIVVTGRFSGKSKSGADLDSAFTHTYEMSGGKVVRLENQVDEGWAAAWS
jgi:ketosteroid isomerase-like protein